MAETVVQQTSCTWSVIIPAWNESLRIVPTVTEAVSYFRSRNVSFEVIVIDDGSTDETAQCVIALNSELRELRVLSHSKNRGKGAAVRTGMLAAVGERRLFIDADGSTPIREVERLEPLAERGFDVVIGSRAMPSAEVTLAARWYRRILGRVFNHLINVVVVPHINDTQCGFKLFSAKAAQSLFSSLQSERFSFDLELLYLARKRGFRIGEVGVNWQHRAGSKVRVVRDGMRMMLDAVAIRLRNPS